MSLHVECSQYTKCSECIIRNPNCAWCDDLVSPLLSHMHVLYISLLLVNIQDTFRRYLADTTDLSPALFCGTRDDLVSRLGCPQESIIYPQSQAQVTEVYTCIHSTETD